MPKIDDIKSRAKTCLIAGASGGVGTALASRLRRDGWRLVRVGRDAKRLPDEGDLRCIADVSTETGATAAIAQATEWLGAPPTAVANCAGAGMIAALVRTSERQYRDCLSANLDTSVFLSKAYVSALQQARQPGAIVLFSTIAARIGLAGHAAVAIAGAGIEALVRAIAADCSSIGIRANAIAPGLLHSPATAHLLSNEHAQRQTAMQYPLGRPGDAAEAAALAAWLLSDQAAWVTGQVIALDGGFSAVRPTVNSRNE